MAQMTQMMQNAQPQRGKGMKRVAFLMIVGVFVLAGMMSACATVQPDAGHEAVLVRKPLIFGSGGVDPMPVKTGLKVGRIEAICWLGARFALIVWQRCRWLTHR